MCTNLALEVGSGALGAGGACQRHHGAGRGGSDLQGREIKRILPSYIFIDKKILPSIEVLGVVGARTVVYEVDDPIEAQTLISAGAEMVETFDIGKLLTAKC